MSKKKQKKEKVVYYDNGAPIVDMSSVGGIGRRAPKDKPQQPQKVQSGFREKWNTYWNTVKMMVFPMLVVLLIITLIFLFFMLL
jgi:hypothetical protein